MPESRTKSKKHSLRRTRTDPFGDPWKYTGAMDRRQRTRFDEQKKMDEVREARDEAAKSKSGGREASGEG